MNAVSELIAHLTAANDEGPFAVGTVVTVTPNGGNPPLVTVNWRGAEVPAICSREVTPVVGRVVLMARVGPQLNILSSY